MITEPTANYSNYREFDREDGRRRGKSDLPEHGNDEESVFLLDVYETRQQHGYLSILFSVAQSLVLIAMMYECGVAPININPMIGPYPDALSYWGAKNAVLIIDDGEKWRLLSPIMLHAGVLHLFGNVSVQLDTGSFFEREWGSPAWLIVYVTGAIGSSLLSTCVMPGMISVGSSGAVMALFGAKLSEVFCRCCESTDTVQGVVGREVRKQQCIGTVGGVTLVMLFSFIPYVDWAAHLGGLLAGMAVGLTLFSCSIRSILFRLIWFIIGLIVTSVGFSETVKYMYNEVETVEELRDVCEYYQQFEGFEDFECSCRKEDMNWGGNDE